MEPDALNAPPIQTRVQFRAEGRFYLEIINDRYVKAPCRDKRCQRISGPHSDHVWDRLTGQRIPEHRIPESFRRPVEE